MDVGGITSVAVCSGIEDADAGVCKEVAEGVGGYAALTSECFRAALPTQKLD